VVHPVPHQGRHQDQGVARVLAQEWQLEWVWDAVGAGEWAPDGVGAGVAAGTEVSSTITMVVVAVVHYRS